MTQQTAPTDTLDKAKCLLKQIATTYETARATRFAPPVSGAQQRVSWMATIAKDLRGATDYGLVAEAEFQRRCSDVLVKLVEKATTDGVTVDWGCVILALKARIERFSFSVDYLSYFAAFCALLFSMALALASTLGGQNYLLTAISAIFGIYSFAKGATVRRRNLI